MIMILGLMEPGPPVVSQAHVTVQGVPVSSVTYPQIQVSGASGSSGHFYGTSDAAPTPVFPAAMSVNLSMNMTMGVPSLGEHFVGTATSSVPPSHVQWTVPSGSYNANGPPAMMSGYGQPVQVIKYFYHILCGHKITLSVQSPTAINVLNET